MAGNADVVRRAVDAFSRRDADDLIAVVHPEVEFRSALGELEGRTYRGHEGARQYLADMYSAWEGWRTSEEEYREAEDDQVVFAYRIRGQGKGSGVPIDRRLAIVFRIEDGQIAFGQVHLDPAAAMTAVGLTA